VTARLPGEAVSLGERARRLRIDGRARDAEKRLSLLDRVALVDKDLRHGSVFGRLHVGLFERLKEGIRRDRPAGPGYGQQEKKARADPEETRAASSMHEQLLLVEIQELEHPGESPRFLPED